MNIDKLLEIGKKCIHSEPPVCSASCPFHVDVISFVSEIEKKDFKKAYKVLENKLPIARLLGKICDHPCEKVCVRMDAGGSIQISELEKAVIEFGYASPAKTLQLPKKKGNVAVIGGGISGLVAASDLNKKGYQVTILEKSDRIGGSFWKYEGKGLERNDIEDEMLQIKNKGITIVLNTEVLENNLQEYIGKFDAVYLGTGIWEKNYNINPNTFQAEGTSLFIGGQIHLKNDSVVFSASSGRRAAISIDRYIAKLSINASREREGLFDTLLDFKVTTPSKQSVKKTSEYFNGEEVVAEASRCLKCQCNECINSCSHLQKYNITPDEYIRSIAHNERIILGTHFANLMINSCAECGLCKIKCPVDIDMKEIIHETRESMVSRGKMPVSAHDFALRDMKFSNSEHFYLVRGSYKDSGKTGYLFYPGCQLSATHTDYIGKIYKHIVGVIKESDVGLYLGCCGAPADWAGRLDLMNENTEKIKSVWEEMGTPVFILACSSCMSAFNKYLPMIKTISLWEILDKYGLPEVELKRNGYVLSIHDACGTRYDENVHESVRNIVKSLGYEIKEFEETKENTKCCGYGGLVSYADKEQSDLFVKDRISESDEDILVYCAMCKDLFVKGNKTTYHILDLIYGKNDYENQKETMPSLSNRQNNRTKLKKMLLKDIWDEEQDMDNIEKYDFRLNIPEDVLKEIDKRYILISDIERVVDYSRKTNERFIDTDTNEYLARLRIGSLTYWVKYEEKENEIYIKGAYSHRMEVVEE